MFIKKVFTVFDRLNGISWLAYLKEFQDFGAFQRIVISARGSRLEILTGECNSYRWILLPELDIGCMQAHISDFYWNIEKLSHYLNYPDTLSTVYGIHFALTGGVPDDQ